jgi:microcystin-dependent protein
LADERPAEDPIEAIARLQRELEDLRSTTGAQMLRRPVGDVEWTLRSTAKTGTLLLQGQTVSRTTYAALWTWALEQGLTGTGKPFGTGDGSTTFVLPDLRGRGPVGSDATHPVGTVYGAATVALAAANMPLHGHSISGSISSVGNHDHDLTGYAGDHDAHNYSGTCDPGFNTFPYGHEFLGNHRHPMTWDGAHTHGHSLSVANAGSATPTPVATQPPSLSGNYLIWV